MFLRRFMRFCYSRCLKKSLEKLNLRSLAALPSEKGILLWETIIIDEILATIFPRG